MYQMGDVREHSRLEGSLGVVVLLPNGVPIP